MFSAVPKAKRHGLPMDPADKSNARAILPTVLKENHHDPPMGPAIFVVAALKALVQILEHQKEHAIYFG